MSLRIRTTSGDVMDLDDVRKDIMLTLGVAKTSRELILLDALEAALSICNRTKALRVWELGFERERVEVVAYNRALHDVRQAAGVVEDKAAP